MYIWYLYEGKSTHTHTKEKQGKATQTWFSMFMLTKQEGYWNNINLPLVFSDKQRSSNIYDGRATVQVYQHSYNPEKNRLPVLQPLLWYTGQPELKSKCTNLHLSFNTQPSRQTALSTLIQHCSEYIKWVGIWSNEINFSR